MNVLTVHGPHPRMLAVLLASDDPRTSWFFQLVRRLFLFTGSDQRVERSNLMRASLHPKLQTRCSGETVRITRLEA